MISKANYFGGNWRLVDSAAGCQQFTGQPSGIIRGQEYGDGCDVSGLSNAAEGRLGGQLLFEIAADESGGMCAFGLYHARVERVDPDLFRPQFFGKNRTDSIYRGLG